MRKSALFVFTGLAMSGAHTAHAALKLGGIEVGIQLFLLLIIVHIFSLFIASKIADFERPEFLLAASCSLGIAVLFFFMLVITGDSGLQAIGLVVVAAAAVVIIQRVYNTTLGKTLIAFVLSTIATAIAARLLSGVL